MFMIMLVGGTVVVEGVLRVAVECVFRFAISTVPHQNCSAFRGEMGVDYFEQSGDICRLFSWIKLNKEETSPAFPGKNKL